MLHIAISPVSVCVLAVSASQAGKVSLEKMLSFAVASDEDDEICVGQPQRRVAWPECERFVLLRYRSALPFKLNQQVLLDIPLNSREAVL